MKFIKNIADINLHDARVTDVITENDDLIFIIPHGLNNDLNDQNLISCKLKFKLVFENEAKITYSKFLYPKIIRKLHKDILL